MSSPSKCQTVHDVHVDIIRATNLFPDCSLAVLLPIASPAAFPVRFRLTIWNPMVDMCAPLVCVDLFCFVCNVFVSARYVSLPVLYWSTAQVS